MVGIVHICAAASLLCFVLLHLYIQGIREFVPPREISRYQKYEEIPKIRLQNHLVQFNAAGIGTSYTSPPRRNVTMMASEKSPLIPPSGVVPPSNTAGEQPTVYFLERRESINMSQQTDAEEIETVPDGASTDQFSARRMTAMGRVDSITPAKKSTGLFSFFKNVSKKSNAFAATSSTANVIESSAILPRSVPVKIDPKVFFANERTFLAWLHVSVILAGASVAIVAFTDSHSPGPGALYGVILLPVSIAFIVYAMIQYTRRASMIRRKSPGPYMDVAGPTVLTVILMLSIVTQFSIKLYTLM